MAHRMTSWVAALIVVLASHAPRPATAAEVHPSPARYRLDTDGQGIHWRVHAEVPIQGTSLRMAQSRPFGVPELDSLGWPGLVRSLRATRASGEVLALSRAGDSGWRLARPETTTVILDYEVDLSPLARDRWPASREAAYRDSAHLSVVGRALFVTTAASHVCVVVLGLPAGWRVQAPWRPARNRAGFEAASPEDLVENLMVMSREPAGLLRVGGFHVQYVAMGWWRSAESDVRRVLQRVVRHHTAAMRSRERRDYLVVLLPEAEQGGEAYRGSFALTVPAPPDSASAGVWGNTIAHEVFHQWNGWRLRGADYASTQWFQEGFTEYMANLAMRDAEFGGERELRARLANHIRRARELTTTLENIGSRKGPSLYSAGALVAFIWDVSIRAATTDRRGIADVLRGLMRVTGQGDRAYAWPDVRAALDATAPGDWEGFHARYIAGHEPLPVAEALARVGLKAVDGGDSLRLIPEPRASAASRRRWSRLAGGI